MIGSNQSHQYELVKFIGIIHQISYDYMGWYILWFDLEKWGRVLVCIIIIIVLKYVTIHSFLFYKNHYFGIRVRFLAFSICWESVIFQIRSIVVLIDFGGESPCSYFYLEILLFFIKIHGSYKIKTSVSIFIVSTITIHNV